MTKAEIEKLAITLVENSTEYKAGLIQFTEGDNLLRISSTNALTLNGSFIAPQLLNSSLFGGFYQSQKGTDKVELIIFW